MCPDRDHHRVEPPRTEIDQAVRSLVEVGEDIDRTGHVTTVDAIGDLDTGLLETLRGPVELAAYAAAWEAALSVETVLTFPRGPRAPVVDFASRRRAAPSSERGELRAA